MNATIILAVLLGASLPGGTLKAETESSTVLFNFGADKGESAGGVWNESYEDIASGLHHNRQTTAAKDTKGKASDITVTWEHARALGVSTQSSDVVNTVPDGVALVFEEIAGVNFSSSKEAVLETQWSQAAILNVVGLTSGVGDFSISGLQKNTQYTMGAVFKIATTLDLLGTGNKVMPVSMSASGTGKVLSESMVSDNGGLLNADLLGCVNVAHLLADNTFMMVWQFDTGNSTAVSLAFRDFQALQVTTTYGVQAMAITNDAEVFSCIGDKANTNIPEPACAMLVWLALAALSTRRRRRVSHGTSLAIGIAIPIPHRSENKLRGRHEKA